MDLVAVQQRRGQLIHLLRAQADSDRLQRLRQQQVKYQSPYASDQTQCQHDLQHDSKWNDLNLKDLTALGWDIPLWLKFEPQLLTSHWRELHSLCWSEEWSNFSESWMDVFYTRNWPEHSRSHSACSQENINKIIDYNFTQLSECVLINCNKWNLWLGGHRLKRHKVQTFYHIFQHFIAWQKCALAKMEASVNSGSTYQLLNYLAQPIQLNDIYALLEYPVKLCGSNNDYQCKVRLIILNTCELRQGVIYGDRTSNHCIILRLVRPTYLQIDFTFNNGTLLASRQTKR